VCVCVCVRVCVFVCGVFVSVFVLRGCVHVLVFLGLDKQPQPVS
jgi:hypothetical protein